MKWVVLWVVFWVGRAIFEILVSFDGLMLLLFVVFEYWKKSIDDSLSKYKFSWSRGRQLFELGGNVANVI